MMLSLNTFLLSTLLSVDWAFGIPHRPVHADTWNTLANIPITARQEHTTVVLNSTALMILGGVEPDSLYATTTARVQIYSIPSNTWHEAAPLPAPLNHVNAAVVDGKVYVLGGMAPNESLPTFWGSLPYCWVYSPKHNHWKTLSNMPDARGSTAVNVYKKTIYLSGGLYSLDLANNGEEVTATNVTAYNTITGQWSILPALPEPRDHAGYGIVDGNLFVLGGRSRNQYIVHDTVYALNLRYISAGWKLRNGRMPTPRGGVASGTIGRKVYTFGGEGNTAPGSMGVFNETEVYDTVKDTWEKLLPMAIPRHGTSAVTIDRKIYIPGGGNKIGGAPVNTFDYFEPAH